MNVPADKKLRQFIKQYQMVDTFDQYLYDTKEVHWKIYLPFFIKNKEITVDMDVVKKLQLKNYIESGNEQWSTDKELRSASFRNIMVFEIALKTVNEDKKIFEELLESGKKAFIHDMVSKINRVLDKKIIVESNFGFCDEDDCQGHVCGEIIYHIIDWAGDYVKGNSLRKTTVRVKP